MPEFDYVTDVAVVGSGGGLCGAVTAAAAGLETLVIEKQPRLGGSTAISGGVLWLPNNPLMQAEGVADSFDDAMAYFDTVVGDAGPASSPARRAAYVTEGAAMVRFLQDVGMTFVRCEGYSDYYAGVRGIEGGVARGRSIEATIFDGRDLGPWLAKLPTGLTPVVVLTGEVAKLGLVTRSWDGARTAGRVAFRTVGGRLKRQTLLSNGAALIGQTLRAALAHEVSIWTDTPIVDLLVDDGHVVGIAATRHGRTVRIGARHGVLLSSGGFARNQAMRETYSRQPNAAEWTVANPGDTGEVIEMAMALGAAVDCMDEAWWVVTSLAPDGQPPKPGGYAADGTPLPFMHHLDLSLPYSMMVDQLGERFCDEAGAYMEIGQRMYKRQQQTGKAVPSWVIMDSRQRAYYPWGTAQPGQVPEEWLKSGYLIKADSIDELVTKTGIDKAGLARTIERFNGFCRSGVDSDFGRGSRAFDRCHGDPTVTPNPNLGAIEKPPFYAVRMYPGDVGTAGGVVTDEHARVLRADGSVIGGLYATGNCTASVVGRCYPGAGASIGASFTFGYIAAHHALGAAVH